MSRPYCSGLGTTLMAEMKESRRSKQGKTPKKSLKSKNKEDKKTKSKKRKKDDKSSSLGLSLLDVPDVGICSLSEETTAVKKHRLVALLLNTSNSNTLLS